MVPPNYGFINHGLILNNKGSQQQVFRSPQMVCPTGSGVWPHADPWQRDFDESYHPKFWRKAGMLLADGWKGCLDGVQADQEFIHKVFKLQRFSCQYSCMFFEFSPDPV